MKPESVCILFEVYEDSGGCYVRSRIWMVNWFQLLSKVTFALIFMASFLNKHGLNITSYTFDTALMFFLLSALLHFPYALFFNTKMYIRGGVLTLAEKDFPWRLIYGVGSLAAVYAYVLL